MSTSLLKLGSQSWIEPGTHGLTVDISYLLLTLFSRNQSLIIVRIITLLFHAMNAYGPMQAVENLKSGYRAVACQPQTAA